MWSVKASASKHSSAIRLTNFMGAGKGATWSEPTLFISPYLGGAVFIDPAREPDIRALTRRACDALILNGKVVKDFATAHPENCIAVDVAVNDGRAQGDCFAFITSILEPAHFPHLSKPFTAAYPLDSRTLVDDITCVSDLKDQGKLNDTPVNLALTPSCRRSGDAWRACVSARGRPHHEDQARAHRPRCPRPRSRPRSPRLQRGSPPRSRDRRVRPGR